jgi:integrase
VKTHTSVRRVPIHQIALDAGFQSYWDGLLAIGERRLFPELPATGKRTKEMSRWFGRAFRPSVGINDPTRTFHSFRHLFKDRCRAAQLRRDLHDSLTGHADASAGAGYGDGLTLDDLKKGIDALTFPGVPSIAPRTGPFVITPGIGAEIPRQSNVLIDNQLR